MDPQLRAEVRRRAGNQCEYCLLREEHSEFDHQLDHILAEQHGGQTVLHNLAFACIHCNRHKGPNVAGFDRVTGQVYRLFNPRSDSWQEHFEWQGAVLVGRTAVGRGTVQALRINRHLRVRMRTLLLAQGITFRPAVAES